MPDPTAGLDQNSLSQILALLAQSQAQNQQGPSSNLGNLLSEFGVQNDPRFVAASARFNSMPTSDMSDAQLEQWMGANRNRTIFDAHGNAMQVPSENLSPGTLRYLINNQKGLFGEGASFTDPNLAKIQDLLKSSQTAPPNLPSVLNNRPPPNVGAVVSGPTGAYINPTKAFLPGLNATGAVAPAPGSLPSLTASPNSAALGRTEGLINQQASLPSLATKLQQGNIQPSDILGAGGPLQASVNQPMLPSSPAAQPFQPPQIGRALRTYVPPAPTPKAATALGGSIEANPAGYNNPGNVFVNQPGQPTVAYPDAKRRTQTQAQWSTIVLRAPPQPSQMRRPAGQAWPEALELHQVRDLRSLGVSRK